MWPFKKKLYTLRDSGLLQGMTDCHSHILPGVDDGVQTLDESLRALRALEELGVRELWLTPHVMEDYPNTPDDLRQRFADLQASYTGIVRLHLAAEHMLDSLFARRLQDGSLLPMDVPPLLRGKATGRRRNVGNGVLVETSYFNPPYGLWNLLEDIRRKGYTPLLAHPERYVYMHTPDYRRLRDTGVLLQLNLLSLCGAYGEDARRKALRLLREGAYAAVGSDLHSLDDYLDYISEPCLSEKDIKQLGHVMNSQ